MANQKVPGLGRKRPQINVSVECLELDSENPRLAKEYLGSTQFDLLKTYYEDFDLEELAYSMSENGYFDEEPLVVVAKKLPAKLKLSTDIVTQQKQLQQLANNKAITFIVIEGNRRAATLKILTDQALQKKLQISDDFPKPDSKDIVQDLLKVPAIYYSDKNEISAYLGVRHIAGLLKWEAYAKAVYLATKIEYG